MLAAVVRRLAASWCVPPAPGTDSLDRPRSPSTPAEADGLAPGSARAPRSGRRPASTGARNRRADRASAWTNRRVGSEHRTASNDCSPCGVVTITLSPRRSMLCDRAAQLQRGCRAAPDRRPAPRRSAGSRRADSQAAASGRGRAPRTRASRYARPRPRTCREAAAPRRSVRLVAHPASQPTRSRLAFQALRVRDRLEDRRCRGRGGYGRGARAG